MRPRDRGWLASLAAQMLLHSFSSCYGVYRWLLFSSVMLERKLCLETWATLQSFMFRRRKEEEDECWYFRSGGAKSLIMRPLFKTDM